MGSSQSKNIPNSSKSSRALRVNTIMGPTNSLLKKRNQSRVSNVIGTIKQNIIREGNIGTGNSTVKGENVLSLKPGNNTYNSRSRSSSMSSTGSRNSIGSTVSRSGSSEILQYTPPINRRTFSIQPKQSIQPKSPVPLGRLPGRKISVGGSRKQRGRKNKNKSRRRKN